MLDTISQLQAENYLEKQIIELESSNSSDDNQPSIPKKKKISQLMKAEANQKRKDIISMFLDNFSPQDISKITMQNERFVKRVIKEYKNFQIIIPRPAGRKYSILPCYYRALNDYILQKTGSVITLRDMSNFLKAKYPENKLRLEPSTIRKMLKMLNISRKKSSSIKVETNSKKILEKRRIKILEYILYAKKGFNFIYIDETSMKKNILPLYGYSQRGIKFRVIEPPQTKNISVIAAISKTELIGYQIFEGSLKAQDFASFLGELIRNNHEIQKNLSKTVFYFDNCSIHKAKLQHRLFEVINILYAPPYSPFINPIEYFFGLWKHYIRQNWNLKNEDRLEAVINAAHSIKNNKIKHILKYCFRFMLRCLKLEKYD